MGTAAAISIIGWEPDREFDHIKSAWTALGDMKIVNRRLVSSIHYLFCLFIR